MNEFKGEISGILNRALDGWRDYRRNGLHVPAAVMNATSEYKSEFDTLETFIRERSIENPFAKVHTTKLFKKFKEWQKKQ